MIGKAGGQGANLVVLPMDRLAPEFFQLRSGLASEMLQKFVTYRMRLAILGDFAELASQSGACAISSTSQTWAGVSGSFPAWKN